MNRLLNWCALACVAGAFLPLAAPLARADAVPASVSPAVAAKLAWRGEAPDMAVPEIRVARKGGFLSVQSDLRNGGEKDQALYYRYRWLDQHGNQVGDGDAWKQLNLFAKAQQTLKGTAPHLSVADFRLELSFETP